MKTLVLSQLTPTIDKPTDDKWRAAAATTFKGDIVVAHDLTMV